MNPHDFPLLTPSTAQLGDLLTLYEGEDFALAPPSAGLERTMEKQDEIVRLLQEDADNGVQVRQLLSELAAMPEHSGYILRILTEVAEKKYGLSLTAADEAMIAATHAEMPRCSEPASAVTVEMLRKVARMTE